MPTVSVVIPSRERRALLRRCLEALAKQEPPEGGFEVVVIDDGSRDGTAEMLASLSPPFELRTLANPSTGKAEALNAGIAAARGGLIVFLDDDMIADPGLVAAHLEAHREEPRTLGIGAITQRPRDGRDWYAHAFARGWNEHMAERERERIGWADCYGANFSAPREAFDRVGGFKPELVTAEDIEMGYRLERAGYVPTYLPRAHGVHDDQKSGRRMLADQRRQGEIHARLAERCQEMAQRLLPWSDRAFPRETALRRALLALRVPPRALAALGALVPGEGRKMLWFHLVRRYTFWSAVRHAVDRPRWRELTAAG